MSLLSDFFPKLGAPDRITVLTTASASPFQWLSGARLARVTAIGAGGAGGATGRYLLSGTYYYNAGGGGGSGAIARAILSLNPAGEAAVPFVVGAGGTGDGGASFFGSYLFADGGFKGNNGSTSSTNTPGDESARAGLRSETINTSQTLTWARGPYLLPGAAGSAGINGAGNTGGAGAASMYSNYGEPRTNPTSGAPLAGNAGGDYGAGGSGASWAPSTTTLYSSPAGGNGGNGCIIVEEWL